MSEKSAVRPLSPEREAEVRKAAETDPLLRDALQEIDRCRTAATRMLMLGWDIAKEAEHWLDGPADTNGDSLLRTALCRWGEETAVFNLTDLAEESRGREAEWSRLKAERVELYARLNELLPRLCQPPGACLTHGVCWEHPTALEKTAEEMGLDPAACRAEGEALAASLLAARLPPQEE